MVLSLRSFRYIILILLTLNGIPAFAQGIQMGSVLYEKLAKTQKEYQEALATGDSLEVAEMCYRLGKRYSAMGEFETAQNWFLRSLRIREPLGPSEDIGKVYLRMAENQFRLKNYELARRYGKQALHNMEQAGMKDGIMSAYNILASYHSYGSNINREKPGSFPEASEDSMMVYYQKALTIGLTINMSGFLAYEYALFGSALLSRDGPRGMQYLKKAYTIHLADRYPYGIINLSQTLAGVYLDHGKPWEAKKMLDVASYVRDTSGQGDYFQNQHLEDLYTRFYRQTGQWEKALEHQKKYYEYAVNDLKAGLDGALSQAEQKYENEKKEARLQAQKEKLEMQQRLTLLAIFLSLLTLGACVVLYWLYRKYRRISHHRAELVKEQNHRVKNNLQSITSLLGLQYNRLTDDAARQAVEESLLRVEAMALVHRRLYDSDHQIEVDLPQYIPELVEGVLRSFSFDSIKTIYALDPLFLHADTAIHVGLLLNELVTNSCKYAFPLGENPTLEIGCREESGRIFLWYSDNGPGFDPVVKPGSFGMKLVEMVVQKLKGRHRFVMHNGCHFSMSFAQPVAKSVRSIL